MAVNGHLCFEAQNIRNCCVKGVLYMVGFFVAFTPFWPAGAASVCVCVCVCV